MKLKEIRLSLNLTQRQIVKAINLIDVSMYSKIENYVCLPTPDVLCKICKVLNCRPQDVYSFKEIDLYGWRKKK